MAFGALLERNRLLEGKILGDLLLQIIGSAIADLRERAEFFALPRPSPFRLRPNPRQNNTRCQTGTCIFQGEGAGMEMADRAHYR
jgi:hypothetical protein